MTNPNSSVAATAGSGETLGYHNVGSKKHASTVDVDEFGHIRKTAPCFRLFVPSQAVGASKVFFDLFHNAGASYKLKLLSCLPVVDGATAVVGTLAVDLFLTRTSAIGTGGTANTSNGSSLSACTITQNDISDALPAGIDARLTPGGGATADAVLAQGSVFTEETSSAAYRGNTMDLVRSDRPIIITNGTGIRVVQGGVASVGNIGFDVVFEVLS